MSQKAIPWHCPSGHLGRGSQLPLRGPQALQNASGEPGARSGEQEETKCLMHGRPWRIWAVERYRSRDFSRLLQINKVFAGTLLSNRSQAMLGLLNICKYEL